MFSKFFSGWAIRSSVMVLVVCGAMMIAGSGVATAKPGAARHGAHAGLGRNVIVFTPSMSQSAIQDRLNAIATQQVPNQFGTQRYAVLFEPGTYGSAADPLIFQVGYYTQVAGLGAQPGDVVINGAIDVLNQCSGGSCEGLNNFWRSVSNLTLNVHLPSTPPNYVPSNGENAGCLNSNEMWAVSQAAPMRRVIMNGTVTLQDYCGQGFVSGGFLADDEFNPAQGTTSGQVINAGQQQFFTRNSNIDHWSNGVWNQVFLGDNGAPPTDFGPGSNQYTTLPSTPVSEEPPFLYTGAQGQLRVFVPAVRHNSTGPSYASGTEAGRSESIRNFFIATPKSTAGRINAALSHGQNLILTPGVYRLNHAINVTRRDTVVLGLGFPTLIPRHGDAAVRTATVPGIKLNGIIVDAGRVNSPALMQVGGARGARSATGRDATAGAAGDPTVLSDVFFRIGGAEPGRATDALVVNSSHVILDDIWAWRADHGAGVGWTQNTAATGLVVGGNHVSAYGLAVEHFQKNEVLWRGQYGRDVFFQNEMPYDPPSQAAWRSCPTFDGYPAFRVGSQVKHFQGSGMGSYSFFNQGVPIYAQEAFASPTRPGDRFQDLLTVFLNATQGQGGILSVIDGVGGSSTAANPDTPVDVNAYP